MSGAVMAGTEQVSLERSNDFDKESLKEQKQTRRRVFGEGRILQQYHEQLRNVEDDSGIAEGRIRSPEDANLEWNRVYDDTISKQYHVHARVGFGKVSIRCYVTTIGDNPACADGPPLSLGWKYDTSMDVEYQLGSSSGSMAERNSKRSSSEWDLIMTRPEREQRLLDAGVTRRDMALAVAVCNTARHQRRQTIGNLKLEPCYERMEAAQKILLRGIRLSSKWLYQAWINQDEAVLKKWCEENKVVLPPSTMRGRSVRRASMMRRSSILRNSSANLLITDLGGGATAAMQQIDAEKYPAFGIVPFYFGDANTTVVDSKKKTKRVPTLPDEEKEPFCKIDLVFGASEKAGIHKGDELIQLGSIGTYTASLGRLMTQLAHDAYHNESNVDIVVRQHYEGVEGPVVVRSTIRPECLPDNGRPTFGLLLTPLGVIAELQEQSLKNKDQTSVTIDEKGSTTDEEPASVQFKA